MFAAATAILFVFGNYDLAPMPEWVWAEDGFFEYLTVGLLLVSSGCLIAASCSTVAAATLPLRFLILAGAFVLLVLALEEISRG